MARKKEIIQAEWDTAQENLVKTLDKADKAKTEVTLTEKDVQEAQAKYDIWKKLLNESIVKIADWKNEKDKKRLEWMKFVETQKTKTDRNFVARIQELWKDAEAVMKKAGGIKALAEVTSNLELDGVMKLKKTNDLVKETEAAIEKRDAATALKKHGAALNYLKGVTPMATKSGLNKLIGNFAKTNKVTINDVDVKDTKLKALFDKIVIAYGKLTEKLEAFEPELAKLTDELANKEPETESKDPLYQAHLKEILSDYKGVVAFSLAGLGKTKKLQGDVQKLVGIAGTATVAMADKVVEAVLKIYTSLQTEYGAVDKHIQGTIRTSESTVTKKRAAYGITQDDQLKTLGPLMDRAFALNFQAKAAFENSIDALRDVLDDMVARFNNEKAKAALGTVTM